MFSGHFFNKQCVSFISNLASVFCQFTAAKFDAMFRDYQIF